MGVSMAAVGAWYSALGAGAQVAIASGVTGVATAGVTAALAPDAPKAEALKPTPMPDAKAMQEAQTKSIVDQLARRGRTASVLTEATGQKLGG